MRFSATTQRRNESSPATLSELAASVPGATVVGNGSTVVSTIVYDSREVIPGALFVALRGGYTDGHLFLDDAVRRDAAAVVIDRHYVQEAGIPSVPTIVTVDSRAALAQLAGRFYGWPSRELALIGITGTDGKTTTAYLLHHILEHAGSPTGLITTVTIRVPGRPAKSSARQTTPESAVVQKLLREMIGAGAQTAILETTSHALVTHRVDECDFDIGIVTNVTSDHLDFHGSLEAYRAAKGELLKRVDDSRRRGKRGIAALNADDEGARSIAKFAGNAEVWWFGIGDDPRLVVSGSGLNVSPAGLQFDVSFGGDSARVHLGMAGTWNVYNGLAAASGALALGHDLQAVANALNSSPAVPGRMELVDIGQPFTIVIDYAHTPVSLQAVLGEMRASCRGRLLVLLGSAGERDTLKRPELGRIAAQLSDFAIFTSEDPRYENPVSIIDAIAEGASAVGAMAGTDFVCIEDRRKAIAELLSRAEPGDTIVLAGKGHERSIIYDNEHRPWNEREVVEEALQAMGYSKQHEDRTA